jgi:hypothetical protein
MKIARVLVACPVLLFSLAASAQEVQVQVGLPPPPPPPPPPRVVIEAQPPPYYGPGGYGPRRPMYYGPGSLDRPRLRLAFGATGGPYIGDNFGGAGGFWAQGGVQINRLIAVYYQTHAMLGAVGAKAGCGLDCSFFGGIWLNEVMIDFTIQDVLQLGIGPSFDIFSVNNFTEGFPGVDARIGVALGGRNEWRRSGFFLGVDVHPTFITDSTFPTSAVATAILLTLGGGWY